MTDTTDSMQITTTIDAQLGAGFFMMVGAHSKCARHRGLQFAIKAKAKNGINRIDVVLNESDEYEIAFWKYQPRGFKMKLIEEVTGLGVEQLHDVIESVTGLATRMPRMINAVTGARML